MYQERELWKIPLKKDRFTTSVCRYLNASEDEAINGIKNLNEKLKEALDKNKKLSEEVAAYEVKDMVDQGDKIGEYNYS